MASSKYTVSMDSAHLLMGKRSAIKLNLVTDNPNGVFVLPDSIPPEVEFQNSDKLTISKKEIGTNKFELSSEYIIQSFDSGDYRIQDLMYVTEGDTAISNAISLKVLPVEVDPEQPIYDEMPLLNAGRNMFDWVPTWWYWILIGFGIIAFGFLGYLILSKRITVKLSSAPRIPPYIVAKQKLDAIKEHKEWANGNAKLYYTDLTNVVREYLEGQFGINAMELTTKQLLMSLRASEFPKNLYADLKHLFKSSDFVKFAKMTPSVDENFQNFQIAENFIESTKPVPDSLPADTSKGMN